MAWFGSSTANDDMMHAPQGMHDFLRAYFHVKSADWAGNHPYQLSIGAAAGLATLPTYYIMDIPRPSDEGRNQDICRYDGQYVLRIPENVE